MGFLLEVFLICMVLLAVILAVSWLYEKYWPKPIPVLLYPTVHSNTLYREYESDYEHIAGFVWRCLCESKCKYVVDTSSGITGIYCEEVANRVIEEDMGLFLVNYEVRCLPQNGLPRSNTRNNYAKQQDLIEEVLNRNLPSYFKAGYGFNGPINVLEISHSRVRVEIHGVYRMPQCYGDEAWY